MEPVYTNDADKLSEAINVFNTCFAEMSQEGQEELTEVVSRLAEQLHKGGGIGSAKELIVQLIRKGFL